MNIVKKIGVGGLVSVIACMYAGVVLAASTPTLTLTGNVTNVNIIVTGADPNTAVMFDYPTDSTGTTFTSIDLGQTDSNGHFNVSVASNSYGLNGGSSVYVSVNGAASSRVTWPTSTNTSGQSGTGLNLSKQSATLSVGQSVSVVATNAVNALSVAGNTNPSVATVSIQGYIFVINALQAGSSAVTVCSTPNGCGTVNVTVQSTNQVVSFSQTQANVSVGQSQAIGIYGPGTYYGLTNSNQNVVSATVNNGSLTLTGITVGQATVSLCANGYQCGSITVNVLSSGTAIPTPVTVVAPSYSDQAPQLSSMTVSSNDVYGLFFGAGSTISVNFTINQGVTNVQVKIAGNQVSPGQGNGGVYSASYKLTGRESLPLPVSISFTNASGLAGHTYFWIGDSAASLTSTGSAGTTNQGSSGSYVFGKYLYVGMTASGVSDADVTALQQRLKTDGVYSGPITGYFGPMTKTALQAYQKKNGLSPVGVVGPSTRTILNRGI